MTPPPQRTHQRKHRIGLLGMTVETATVLACIITAIAIVWWAA